MTVKQASGNGFHGGSAALREGARNAIRKGDMATAERYFQHVLGLAPADVEALRFIAGRQLVRGETQRSVETLATAHLARPKDSEVLHELGISQVAAGDLQGAEVSLTRCVALAPEHFVARLRLAVVHERQGRADDALNGYLAAINLAQAHGRWLSDDTTVPMMREAVQHAMRYVAAGRGDR